MRYLRAPNQFQLRLGWLSVIASIVGENRCSRGEIEAALEELARADNGEIQSGWLTQAGLASPQGRLSPRAVPDIARMGIAYGIYDPDAQALTDLGHVLRVTTCFRPEVTPFTWRGAARFIGTRVLFGVNGDVSLTLLRQLPEGAVGGDELAEYLAHCLEITAQDASGEDRAALDSQVERVRDHALRDRVNRALVFPHLEPLRELGYLTLAEKGGYAGTPAGRKLAESFPRGNADEFLREGIARTLLSVEGIAHGAPAGAPALHQTLLTLPGPLVGAHAEAPLEPVVLLTHARLMSERSGAWMDMRRAAELAEALERGSGGRIGIKAGRSGEEQNITWRERLHLDDARLWQVGAAEAGAPSPPPADPPAPPLAAPPSVREAAPLRPHAVLWLAYVEHLLAPPALGDAGGLRRGGPLSWIVALRKLLDMPEDKLKGKRAPILLKDTLKDAGRDPRVALHGQLTVATGPLRRWLERLDHEEKSALRAFAECARLWSPADPADVPHVNDLRGAFLWAERNADQLTCYLSEIIRELIHRDDRRIQWETWDLVREATRSLIDDALQLGLWHPPELLARLRTLHEEHPSTAAAGILQELTGRASKRDFSFTQTFSVSAPLLELLGELAEADRTVSLDDATVEISRSLMPAGPGDDGGGAQPDEALSIMVNLRARTEEQALSRGAEYAAEAVSRLAFLGTLRTGPAATLDAASVRARDDGRLVGDDGRLYMPAGRPEMGLVSPRPEDVGILLAPTVDQGLIGVVRKLPALAAIDRGVALDGRARLARSLHWLSLADAPHLRPAERLSHGWVAYEHLFAEGEQKGHLVAELSSPVVVLCYVRAAAARLYRDALAALHCSVCQDPRPGALQGLVERWLGADAWAPYATRGPGRIIPLAEPLRVTEEEAFRKLLDLSGDHGALAKAVEEHAPLVTWQMTRLGEMLGNRRLFRAWLQQRQRDAVSFLMGVYEVRNQLVHEANPFGFDDAYRLQNLYERYRVTINPVVAEILRLSGSDLAVPLKHSWAILRARFGEMMAQTATRPGKADRGDSPVDIPALLGCFRGS